MMNLVIQWMICNYDFDNVCWCGEKHLRQLPGRKLQGVHGKPVKISTVHNR